MNLETSVRIERPVEDVFDYVSREADAVRTRRNTIRDRVRRQRRARAGDAG
jgi:hypothetical protein